MRKFIVASFLVVGSIIAAPEPLHRDTVTKALIQTALDLKSVTLTLGNVTVSDAAGIRTFDFGASNGTKLGAAGNKIGFLGATPIVRPSSTTDLRQALINLGLYTTGGATPLNLNGGTLTATTLTGTSGTLNFTGTLAGPTLAVAGNETIGGTLSVTGAATFRSGANFNLIDFTDASKKVQFDLTNVVGTRAVNIPNANSTTAQAKSAVASQFLTAMSTQGVFTAAQPAYSGLTGLPVLAQSQVMELNSFLTSYDEDTGLFGFAIPNFSNLSGVATTDQIPNLDVAKITTGAFEKARQHAATAYTDATTVFTQPLSSTSQIANLDHIDVSRAPYNVDMTGTVDGTTAFNNARAAAIAAGVALYMPKGIIKISSTIAITAKETWRGYGASLSSANGTKLLWAGANGGTMVTSFGDFSQANWHGEMSNITFDGNSLAAYCLILDGVCFSNYSQLSFKGFTTGAALKCTATVHPMARNVFRHIVINGGIGDGIASLWLTGGTEHDATLNSFYDLYAVELTAVRPGIRLGFTDENIFFNTNLHGTPGVLVAHTETTNLDRPNGNFFYFLLCGGGWVQNAGFVPLTPNHIYGYGTSNSEPAPILNGTGGLLWTDESGRQHTGELFVDGPIKPQTSDGTAQYTIDATGGDTITVANGVAAPVFGTGNVFGGMVLIADTGRMITAMFLVGYQGSVNFMGDSIDNSSVLGSFTKTAATANRSNFYYAGDGLKIENRTGTTVTYRVVSVRMTPFL